jgi:flavin-dependent dehydrogenase
MSDNNFDAVVAGAGVAGTVFAARLAALGHKVIICEPSRREDIGHDWWDSVDLSSFDAAGITRPEPPELRTSFQFNVNVKGTTYPTLTFMPDDIVNVERKLLAARLIAHAIEAGVTIRFGVKAVGPILHNGNCVGMTVVDSKGKQSEIRAPITVDATGAAGALRAAFGPKWGFDATIPESQMMITYREIRRDTSNGGKSVICLGDSNATNWISREPDGLCDIFAGAIGSSDPSQPCTDPKILLEQMVATEGGVGDSIVRAGHYCRIPLRRPFDGVVGPGFMLIGDSACMANPINGSGVTSSISAAIIAAETAHQAILKNDFSVAGLWDYPYRFFRKHAEFAFLDVFKNFVFFGPRAPMLAFFKAGGLNGPAFWKMRDEFKLAGLAAKIKVVLATPSAVTMAPGLADAMVRALLAEALYKTYPRRYTQRGFASWRRRLHAITG